jgi:ParB family chromosome partitioning protein
MAKLAVPGTAGFNAGQNYYSKPVRIGDIFIDPEISKTFAIQEKIRKEIERSIKEKGFDKSQPVVLWKGKNILVDGHTRLAAAKEAGLEEIPATEMDFESREAALLYTIARQAARRNLAASEVLAVVQMLNDRKTPDGMGRAAEQLAERLGVSAATVYHAQKIAREAPEEVVEAVRKGEQSIGSAYRQITKKKEKKPSAPKKEPPAAPPENPPAADTELPDRAAAFVKEIGETVTEIDFIAAGQTATPEQTANIRSLLERVREYFISIGAKG